VAHQQTTNLQVRPATADALPLWDADRMAASLAAAAFVCLAAFRPAGSSSCWAFWPCFLALTDAAHAHAGYGPHKPFMARLIENRRLTALGHFQDVRHLTFDLHDSGLHYEPGDTLAVVPRQPPAAVDTFLKRLGLPPSAHVRVQLAEPPANGAEPPCFQVPAQLQPAGGCACSWEAAVARQSYKNIVQWLQQRESMPLLACNECAQLVRPHCVIPTARCHIAGGAAGAGGGGAGC